MCTGLFDVSMLLNAAAISSEEIRSTIFGVANIAMFVVPWITCNIVGGLVTEKYGVKVLFQGLTFLNGIWSVFIFLHVLYDRKMAKKGNGKIPQELMQMIPVENTENKDMEVKPI